MDHKPHLRFHQKGTATGPVSFLNPTRREFNVPKPKGEAAGVSNGSSTSEQESATTKDDALNSPKEETPATHVRWQWRSRDNRKGRHTLKVRRTKKEHAKFLTPPSTTSLKATLLGVVRMFTTYPYYDISYLVAVQFVIGSVVWVINGFFAWLPLAAPSTEFPGEITDGGGWTAFIGATIFELGSIFLMIEAINENRSDCFGWVVEETLEENGLWRIKQDADGCRHHHRNKRNIVGKGTHQDESDSREDTRAERARAWTWWPTWTEFTQHYLKEIGFLACFFQMIGATVFWISGFTALPGIYDRLTTDAAVNGAYWSPQVIGGSGFIISSTLFMLETQQKWYLPAPHVLGWHIGLWNLIGAIGFTLCGALGYGSSDSGVAYQASLATFWGSWAFLIGSAIQWFESLDKHPVEVEEGGGRVADTQPVA